MLKSETAKPNRKRGKRVQAKIAKKMNADNVGGLGGEDCRHAVFSIEAKGLTRFVGQRFMLQAEKNCPKGKIPIVRVHIMGELYSQDIILMRANTLDKLEIKGKKGEK